MGGIFIVNVQTEHQGRYECRVETPVDSYTRFADLTVYGKYSSTSQT